MSFTKSFGSSRCRSSAGNAATRVSPPTRRRNSLVVYNRPQPSGPHTAITFGGTFFFGS